MAVYFNCSKSTILNYAKKIGYDNSNNKELKISKFPIKQIIQDYEELLSCEEVGKKYGCSANAVRQYLIKNNYHPINHNHKTKDFDPDSFIHDYNELQSAEAMGKKYNCSSTTILNFAKKINYDVNSNKNYWLDEKDKQYIVENYYEKTSTELAKELKVNRGLITKVWFDNHLLGKQSKDIQTTEKDITGQDIGLWHVMYKTNKRNAGGVIYWHCKCQCGVERDILGTSLRQGLSLSCGNHKNISKGNYQISQILQNANIQFETEKIFSTCKDKTYLPFDFYVNNSYLIEFDGIQHFQEGFFNYEYTHNHDLIKNKWCKENNVPLIRIPYTHLKDLHLEDLLLEASNFLI